MDLAFLDFVRGPLLKFALVIFFFGIAYRIFRVIAWGVPKNRAKPKGNPAASAISTPFLKPFRELTFQDVMSKRAIQYIGGFTFHITFLLLVFFIPQHSFLWTEVIGIKLPYFSSTISNILAYGALLSILALWLNRFTSPVLRLLTGAHEHIGNFLITITILTGIVATQWVGGGTYISMLGLHMLFADLLIIYIPFSRLAHFIDYFFSTGFYGRSIGISGVRE